mmetsp:Transcript_20962/g.52950  ORF Transcript_20962/g.52950 Transcript_20962/m.52950 type:complete len:260 (-) Transcript_20962:114-893(-)
MLLLLLDAQFSSHPLLHRLPDFSPAHLSHSDQHACEENGNQNSRRRQHRVGRHRVRARRTREKHQTAGRPADQDQHMHGVQLVVEDVTRPLHDHVDFSFITLVSPRGTLLVPRAAGSRSRASCDFIVVVLQQQQHSQITPEDEQPQNEFPFRRTLLLGTHEDAREEDADRKDTRKTLRREKVGDDRKHVLVTLHHRAGFILSVVDAAARFFHKRGRGPANSRRQRCASTTSRPVAYPAGVDFGGILLVYLACFLWPTEK